MKVIGMHFMNPVPIMELVEIIPGLRTNAGTLASTEKLCAEMKKAKKKKTKKGSKSSEDKNRIIYRIYWYI